jgi:hypothetical protein
MLGLVLVQDLQGVAGDGSVEGTITDSGMDRQSKLDLTSGLNRLKPFFAIS